MNALEVLQVALTTDVKGINTVVTPSRIHGRGACFGGIPFVNPSFDVSHRFVFSDGFGVDPSVAKLVYAERFVSVHVDGVLNGQTGER
jgi:hypothetical protein